MQQIGTVLATVLSSLTWLAITGFAMVALGKLGGKEYAEKIAKGAQRGVEEAPYPIDPPVGERVTRLAFSWQEHQPGFATWEHLSNKKSGEAIGQSMALANFVLQALCWVGAWSNPTFPLVGALLFAPILGAIAGGAIGTIEDGARKKAEERREDDTPISFLVDRDAFVERWDGRLWFVVRERFPDQPIRVALRVPWDEVGSVSVRDYWPTFHSGQLLSGFRLRYLAIVAESTRGGFLLLSPTVEGENVVSQRRESLDRIFGSSAREEFVRREEMGRGTLPVNSARNDAASRVALPSVGSVPPKFD